ncbi:MAG: methionine--tRNA ligase [Candidatus Dojkabacteria bacterium]|uniref:Methionine--tRNA ligase n=2 Tax=Candidatus Dojkabacteria TaxID=74243 RepID=A0A136KHQ6_9BACT|nr:MAG: Methionine--tRNA ligase [candidate division WS6 bacterium OLB21]MBW7953943.1 methionine--tRNA ligase [Candidatus Dojkabacteria bacterium]WKZ27486.1 MAG: methionine--tRNA ligase [Candidatus Dojkabacteria bacterium]
MHKKILVGVAWPYVNGDIHLGHLAGYLIPADIVARYQRLRGNDVLMVSGSDTHGTPITVEADKKGVQPAEIVKQYHQNDIQLFKKYRLSYNLYTSTQTENHKRVVQELFLDLLKNDYIVKGTMKQYFATQDNQFLPDRYVEGTCPYCKAGQQRSDQCESCGRWIEDGELIDPVSKLSGSPVELKDTEHYFLDFSKLDNELKQYVEDKKDIWRNWVWKETNGWLKEGMKKRAITRDMDWAIDLPVEEILKLDKSKQLENYDGKKIYVWFEAVIGYLSAPQEWAVLESENEDIIFTKGESQDTDWQNWWLNQDSEHYYFMGQDNLVFHTLMWPAQLIGSKRGYKLPTHVVVNKFMNYEGKKFSKSRGWTIDSAQMADKFGTDAVRYYISANLPEHKEANFTWEGFTDAINNELVANFGNLVNRSLTFFAARYDSHLTIDDYKIDTKVQAKVSTCFAKTSSLLDMAEISPAVNEIMALAKFGNQYFETQAIWKVIKEKPEEAEEIMLNLLNLLANLSVLIAPILPNSSSKLMAMLGINLPGVSVDLDLWQPQVRNSFALSSAPEILFTKLDRDQVVSEKV